MKKVVIYDPAMCCSTGVCGPSVDPNLTRVASAVYSLEQKGFDIKRYQLTSNPEKFAENKEIQKVFVEKGLDALPAVMVDDEIVKIGSYPTNEEFAEWFGVKVDELYEKPKAKISFSLD
ncbi:arsenite efflux transporter metallochaperone ArsD (plasmid) [Ureibacillus chungkukjangi]|uniref:arsenite efflux transporter metallochaperone ArsD n=1 Tax=Ureibacillus chungkukjangi TaxID=1202712 RepID=UPI000D3466CA|nr:arsenite efflux transporter metallochaperone ArsD [Ureibacillus chungkukjangi]MCM3390460.1 arsenite efflux transporter metallochaperone ArsD [Ureibacillus chungkukjangi]